MLTTDCFDMVVFAVDGAVYGTVSQLILAIW